jgi:hypothetical protein
MSSLYNDAKHEICQLHIESQSDTDAIQISIDCDANATSGDKECTYDISGS